MIQALSTAIPTQTAAFQILLWVKLSLRKTSSKNQARKKSTHIGKTSIANTSHLSIKQDKKTPLHPNTEQLRKKAWTFILN